MADIQYRVDIVYGIFEAPTAINKLFDGSNKGKLIVKVFEEPSLKPKDRLYTLSEAWLRRFNFGRELG